MKLAPNWYVPVLKSKPGEFEALRQLRERNTDGFTPVIEIVEQAEDEDEDEAPPELALFKNLRATKPTRRTPEEHIRSKMDGLHTSLGERVAYIDPHEVSGLDQGSEIAFRFASELRLSFIPVIGLNRINRDLLTALPYARSGLAIRVVADDLRSWPSLDVGMRDALRVTRYDPREIDLLVDAQELPGVEGGRLRKLQEMLRFCSGVPVRNLILVASSMPQSVSKLPYDADTPIRRSEWGLWRELRRRTHDRALIYGDHGVQHSAGVEAPKGKARGGPPIAIRYTQEDTWVIAKGPPRGAGVSPSEEYPRVAERLASNRDVYRTPFHCPGCREIARSAEGTLQDGGSPKAWRRIGAAHHITLVTEQLLRERYA